MFLDIICFLWKQKLGLHIHEQFFHNVISPWWWFWLWFKNCWMFSCRNLQNNYIPALPENAFSGNPSLLSMWAHQINHNPSHLSYESISGWQWNVVFIFHSNRNIRNNPVHTAAHSPLRLMSDPLSLYVTAVSHQHHRSELISTFIMNHSVFVRSLRGSILSHFTEHRKETLWVLLHPLRRSESSVGHTNTQTGEGSQWYSQVTGVCVCFRVLGVVPLCGQTVEPLSSCKKHWVTSPSFTCFLKCRNEVLLINWSRPPSWFVSTCSSTQNQPGGLPAPLEHFLHLFTLFTPQLVGPALLCGPLFRSYTFLLRLLPVSSRRPLLVSSSNRSLRFHCPQHRQALGLQPGDGF